jgi:Fe-S cluster assembly scaffold protein SufB
MRNMKYPACILKGDNAKGSVISIAVGGKNQFQDNGARMIHIGKNTSSTIISKSICKNGGTRELPRHRPDSCREPKMPTPTSNAIP